MYKGGDWCRLTMRLCPTWIQYFPVEKNMKPEPSSFFDTTSVLITSPSPSFHSANGLHLVLVTVATSRKDPKDHKGAIWKHPKRSLSGQLSIRSYGLDSSMNKDVEIFA